MRKQKMNNIWTLSIADYIKIMEEAIILGKERGKKEGDNIEQEFFEIVKKRGMTDKIKHLGITEMDKDLFLGNLREETKLKILDLSEEERKRKNGC
jgi:hypothetical protein